MEGFLIVLDGVIVERVVVRHYYLGVGRVSLHHICRLSLLLGDGLRRYACQRTEKAFGFYDGERQFFTQRFKKLDRNMWP